MKKYDLSALLSCFGPPAALMIGGLVLLFSPDSGAILLTKLLGFGLLLAGGCFALMLLQSRNRGQELFRLLLSIVCLAAGSYLTANPLMLARGIGRVLGLLLLIRGVRDLFCSTYSSGKVLSCITALAGVLLVVLPMTTSRLVFSLLGLFLVLLGVGMLLERLRHRRYLEGGDDPNIIDAL